MFKRGLNLERTFPHTMEHVWRALTDPVLLAKWLMKNDFRPEIGHRFSFQTSTSPGFNGIIMCEVTELEAPHLLAYTWTGGLLSRATTVRWTLEPSEDGTRLTLEHSGFNGVTGMLASGLMGSGWRKMMGERLPLVLDGKEIPKQPVMLMKND